MAPRQQIGKLGEKIAVDHLKKNGYIIIEQNHRTKNGEIDIIASDGQTLAFIEVKTLSFNNSEKPKSAVTITKQKKLSILALQYLKRNQMLHKKKARFDVVSISLGSDTPEIELIKNAFELAYEE